MLVLHAFLVMCEISLVKFRYRKPSEEQLDELKNLLGVARLIDNSDQTGRVVRFSKTLCTVAGMRGSAVRYALSHVYLTCTYAIQLSNRQMEAVIIASLN